MEEGEDQCEKSCDDVAHGRSCYLQGTLRFQVAKREGNIDAQTIDLLHWHLARRADGK